MRPSTLLYGALALVGLVMTPVLAFDAANSNLRGSSAAVSDDATAFSKITNLGPTSSSPILLNAGNDYDANALTLRNDYVVATTFTVQATLVENPEGRFRIPNPAATFGAGGSHTFRIEDDAMPHLRICTTVVYRLDITVNDAGGARTGHFQSDERVWVKVGAIPC